MFDTIVITAADSRQATCFHLQAQAFEGTLAKRVLVIPDPGGRRVGTLGSTVHVLKNVSARGRLLVCHCGGFSKRLPAYAASGKVFAPVPAANGVKTLFEIIVRNMARLELPRNGALVVCGDVAPDFDFSACDFSAPGVTGVAYRDTLARGSRHGVYVAAKGRGAVPVKDFLQKPSAAESRRSGAVVRGKVAVDTGILWLDAPTCAKLRKSRWTEGDLYSDFTAALLKGFADFRVNVVPRCNFFHIGSSRELLDLLGRGREWVDGCGVPRAEMRLAGENIVTNVPAGYEKKIALKRGECLLCLPTGRTGWTEVRYRVEDNFKEDGKWESLKMGELMKRVDPTRLGRFRAAQTALPQEVVVEKPLRIDLAGGWSDTPPICNAMGGCVLNAAVTLGGEKPVKVAVRRIPREEVCVASVDLGKKDVLRTVAEIHDHSDPHDWRALVKAALVVTGYSFAEGGLSIVLSADVPKGSGMGTSSILGAAVVEALGKIRGRGYSVEKVADLTLALEREMNTGGGWEDQMGALEPGVKLLVSRPGKNQKIAIRRLPAAAEKRFAEFLDERALLYFTGQKRMARNVLNGVVSFFRKNPDGLAREIVRVLKKDALQAYKALACGDWTVFTEAVNAYWMNKKALDPGSTNPMVESIIARIAPFVSAVTLCGAGGGGFMFIIARSRTDRQRVRHFLQKGSSVRCGRFYDLSLAF